MSRQATVRAPSPDPDAVKAIYFVTADAQPGLLPRLVAPFAKLGLTLDRCHASTENGAGDALEADLRVAGLGAREAHLIEKALRAIVGVRSVIALVD